MATFNPDQEQAILNWLQDQQDAGLTLQEVINGIISGTLTTEVLSNTRIPQPIGDVA